MGQKTKGEREMKTKVTIYLINGELVAEEVTEKSRREVEADIEKTMKEQKGSFMAFRYTDGVKYIPISSILYMIIKEIS